jgi:hypothetical protein
VSRAARRGLRAAVAAWTGAVLVATGLVAVSEAGELPPEADLQKLVEQRQEIVRATLQLDPKQKAAFEEAYSAYESERNALARERHGFADDFAESTLAMSASQADALIDRFLRLRRQRIELDEKFRPRFEAALSPQKTLLLFQLNFILDAVVNYDLAAMVPLAR